MARHRQKKGKKPKAVEPAKHADGGALIPLSAYSGIFSTFLTRTTNDLSRAVAGEDPQPSLADRVADDVLALTADFDGEGGLELPAPPADLTTYADAFASARKACPHTNAESTMYAQGEYYCSDCRRYIKANDIKRTSFWWMG